MTTETFDIIIPVADPDEKLGDLLAMIAVQTVTPGRVILMETVPSLTSDNVFGSAALKSLAAEKLRSVPQIGATICPVERTDFDHAGTRRTALAYSEAPYFLMMTQDAVPSDAMLCERLLSRLTAEKAALCYARQLARPDAGDIEKVTRDFNYPAESRVKTKEDIASLGIKAFFASNVCCLYDRKIYEELGGFPDHAIFNEDMIYARKVLDAGEKIAYEAEAKVVHSHDYGLSRQFCRNFDLGVSQADHPETFGGIPSEGEGVRLVLCTMRKVSPLHIPRLILQSAAKYLGYRMGKRYRTLKLDTVKRCTSNPAYVKKYIEKEK